ncbi:MAG: hypothetical protein HOP15_04745 [Planctomycetes bacterium]|nr:hypothetical protein [Planctomycetota bacterium]
MLASLQLCALLCTTLGASGRGLQEAVVRLNGPLARPVVGTIQSSALLADGTRAVYTADLDTDEQYELYATLTDGSAATIKLSHALAASADITHFQLARTGTWVVYRTSSELFSVPPDRSRPPVRLNGLLVSQGSVGSYGIDASGSVVAYVADQDTNDVNELYGVPIERGTSPVKLSAPMTAGGDVRDFQLSADGSHAVYRADQDDDEVLELYAVDAGLAPVKLSGSLVAGGDVGLGEFGKSYEISVDETRVVYRADQLVNGVAELFSVAMDAQLPAVRLNAELPSGGMVSEFALDPTSRRAVYVADQETRNVLELYSVPIDGSALPVKLNVPLPSGADVENTSGRPAFSISPDGTRVVFVVSQPAGRQELHCALIDGRAQAVRLEAFFAGYVRGFQVRPDSLGVVFRAWLRGVEGMPVYSVPIDGSTSPRELSGPFPPGSFSDFDFAIVAGSERVVYVADQDVRNQQELYGVPCDGSAAPVRLSGPQVLNGDVDGFELALLGEQVLYRADQEIDSVLELYGVPAGGGAPAHKLHPTLPLGPVLGDVASFAVDPSGTYAVYAADQTTVGRLDVFSVRCDGSAPPVRLDEAPADGSPYRVSYKLAPDGRNVVLQRQTSLIGVELFSRAIDGSVGPTLLATASVRQYEVDTALSPDGRWLVYRESRRPGTQVEYLGLHSVPLDGSSPARALSDWGVLEYRCDPTSKWVVCRLGGALYSMPIDGSAPPVRLHPLLARGIEPGWLLTSDGRSVVYRADQKGDGSTDLFVVPIDGGARPRQLSLAFQSVDVLVSADSTRAVYAQDEAGESKLWSVRLAGSEAPRGLARLERLGSWELAGDRVVFEDDPPGVAERLWVVPIDGSAPARELRGLLRGDRYASSFWVSPDAARVVFHARLRLLSAPLDGSQDAVALISGSAPFSGASGKAMFSRQMKGAAHVTDRRHM